MKLFTLMVFTTLCASCRSLPPRGVLQTEQQMAVNKVAEHIRATSDKHVDVVVALSGGCTYNAIPECINPRNAEADSVSRRKNAIALMITLRTLHLRTNSIESIYTQDALDRIMAASSPQGRSAMFVLMDLPYVNRDTTSIQYSVMKITGGCKTCSARMYVHELKWITIVDGLSFQLDHPFAKHR